MQRLFSAFPGGWPGAGLLLLRMATGLAALVIGATYAARLTGDAALGWLGAAVASISGLSLILGLLTPAAALIVGLASAALGVARMPPPLHLLDDPMSLGFLAVVATAIVLLGPGAYSLDSYLFGRRELVIPHERPPRA